MPIISQKLYLLYNLKVELRTDDHNTPHIHITCVPEEVKWIIDLNGVLRVGSIKTKNQRKLFKIMQYWMEIHKDELWVLWNKAINSEKVDYID